MSTYLFLAQIVTLQAMSCTSIGRNSRACLKQVQGTLCIYLFAIFRSIILVLIIKIK